MFQKWRQRLSLSPKKQQQQHTRDGSIESGSTSSFSIHSVTGSQQLNYATVTATSKRLHAAMHGDKAHGRVDSAQTLRSEDSSHSHTSARLHPSQQHGSSVSTPTLASGLSIEEDDALAFPHITQQGSIRSTARQRLPSQTSPLDSMATLTTRQLQELYKAGNARPWQPTKTIRPSSRTHSPTLIVKAPTMAVTPPPALPARSASTFLPEDNLFAPLVALSAPLVTPPPPARTQLFPDATNTHDASRRSSLSFNSNDERQGWSARTHDEVVSGESDVLTARKQALRQLEANSPDLHARHDSNSPSPASPTPHTNVAEVEVEHDLVVSLAEAAAWADAFDEEEKSAIELPKPYMPHSPAGSDRSSLRRMTTDEYNFLMQTMHTPPPESDEDAYQDDDELMQKHETELAGWRAKQASVTSLHQQALQASGEDVFKPLPRYRKTKLNASVSESDLHASLKKNALLPAAPMDDADDDVPLDQLMAQRRPTATQAHGLPLSTSTPNLLARPGPSPLQLSLPRSFAEQAARSYSSASLLGLRQQTPSKLDLSTASKASSAAGPSHLQTTGTLLAQAARQQDDRQHRIRGHSNDALSRPMPSISGAMHLPYAQTARIRSPSPLRSAACSITSNSVHSLTLDQPRPGQPTKGSLASMMQHYLDTAQRAHLAAEEAEAQAAALQREVDEAMQVVKAHPVRPSSSTISMAMPVLQHPVPRKAVTATAVATSSLMTSGPMRPESTISTSASTLSKRYRAHATHVSLASTLSATSSISRPHLGLSSATSEGQVENVATAAEMEEDEDAIWQQLALQKRRLGKTAVRDCLPPATDLVSVPALTT